MRRRHLLGALALAIGSGHAGNALSQEGFATAAAAARSYDDGDYEASAATYRQLLDEDSGNLDRAALHYNLGNAEYRTGRLGHAMLHWERSLAIRPGDTDARANVALARSVLDRRLTDAAASGDPDTFLVELLGSMQGFPVWLRQTPPARFAWPLSAFVLLAGVCWTLLTVRRGRRGLLLTVLGLSLVATTTCGILLRLRLTVSPVAVVVQPGAALRSGPGHSFPQLAALPEGLYLELDGEGGVAQDGFRRVVAAGIVGYADGESVVPVVERGQASR